MNQSRAIVQFYAAQDCRIRAIAAPQKLARFSHFINSDQPDPSLVKIEERGQTRPAFDYEKELLKTSDRL